MSKFVKKSQEQANNKAGFTIVELLVVIVVIAILAAIAIVSYNGIAKRSVEATMQNDLQSAASLLEIESGQTGSYPALPDGLNGGKGLVGSGSNQLAYIQTQTGYCVSVTNPKTSTTFKISNTTGKVVEGDCLLTNGAVMTTIAGSTSTTSGFVDNVNGTAARFTTVAGIVKDSAGNLFVADSSNRRIRKITPAGDVTTFAGSGGSGMVDSINPLTAQFGNPVGIAMDSVGNIYVADFGRAIRKITPAGVVTLFAGTLSQLGGGGYVDGNGATARFAGARYIAVDSSDNLYVSEGSSHRIRKITPAGDVTTFAGSTEGYANGNGTAALFSFPEGIAIGPGDALYVTDSGNNRIRKIMPNGDVTTFAGSGGGGTVDGVGTSAQFGTPGGIAIDPTGNMYVTSIYHRAVRKITPSGAVSAFAATPAVQTYLDGTGLASRMGSPSAIMVDKNGIVYVGEDYRVRKIE